MDLQKSLHDNCLKISKYIIRDDFMFGYCYATTTPRV